MRALDVWTRLAWRELREGWLPVAAGLVAPAVLFPVAGQYPSESWQASACLLAGSAGVQLLVIFWAVAKADRKRHGAEFASSHLPIRPVAEWTASFAVPLAVIAGVGAWYGSRAFDTTGALSDYCLAGMLDLASTFALGYFFSLVVSKWAGIFVGVAHMIGGSQIDPWTLRLLPDAQVTAVVAGLAIGSAIGSGVFAWLESRKSVAVRQGIAMALLIACAFAPLAPGVDAGWLFPKPSETSGFDYWYSPDDTIAVYLNPRGRPLEYQFHDRPREVTVDRDFRPVTRTIGVRGRRYVYLAQQLGNEDSIRILEWDTATNTVKKAAWIPARRGMLPRADMDASVDPERRHALLGLPAMVGDEVFHDLWLVDFARGRGEIAIPQMARLWRYDVRGTIWLSDRAIMSGMDIIQIDLAGARAHVLAISRRDRR